MNIHKNVHLISVYFNIHIDYHISGHAVDAIDLHLMHDSLLSLSGGGGWVGVFR